MDRAKYLAAIQPHYSGYQELHVHSVGSFRDAVNEVKDIFDAAEELGRRAVSITDHGNWTRLFEALKERTKREKRTLEKTLSLTGTPEADIKKALKVIGDFDSIRCPNEKMWPFIEKYEDAYVMAAKESVQFIPGVEMYECLPVEGDEHRWHILFLAKDWMGAQALFRMCNLAQLNKHNEMPRCTTDTMKLFLGEGSEGHGHVIATSACLSGKISDTLLTRYYLNRKKEELLLSQEKMTVIAPEVIKDAQSKIAEMVENIAIANEDLASAKKLAKRKFDTAIKRAEKAYEKAVAGNNPDVLSMFSADDESVRAAKERLDGVLAEAKASQHAAARLPELTLAVSQKKDALKKMKEALANLEKANRPAARVQAKIDVVDEKIAALGDTFEQAKRYALEYEAIFGKGNFYIELQDHGLDRELLLKEQLIRLAEETGIPMTVANDVHYKDLAMKRKRDIVAALRFPNLTLADIANQVGNDQLYFKSDEQMMQLFVNVPTAIENTNRIAEACNVYYKKEMHLPRFVDTANGLSPAQYLRKMATKNVIAKYPDCKQWTPERQKAFKERLFYELGVIEKMGYSSYISIVEDFIRYTREHFGPESVGPGRGSGAGSLVCYLIGITNIDPLRYGLIFERFLNPERVSMPDIDTDFAPSIRDKVIEYVAERYAYKGEYIEELKGTVCAINTEGVLAAKSSVRQVGKVTGVPLTICDRIAKLIPMTVGMTLKKALKESNELFVLYNEDEQVKMLLDDAILVEGTPVQTGVHAAGVIIADRPISDYAPMFWNEKKNTWVIQYDMVSCEADCGMLKMDFLGLRNLDIIMRCKSFIKKSKDIVIDSVAIEQADDESVITAIYGKADTDGIFQFESGGMKKILRSFSPKQIEDVILLNAAYRPGPMQYIPQVTDVKFQRAEPNYIVPEMKGILEPTYGSPIYQEQIQQIFHKIAGFSLGQADIIRRAMSKKHLDELVAAKDGFVSGFKKKGAKETDIEKFWNELLDFAKYAFNKSHAAAYSVLSYYTAWLKHYYPVEYMASLMSYSTKENVGLYVKNAKDYGIKILPPDVNCSLCYTAPTQKGEIRFGLEGLKDVGAAAEKIVEERKTGGRFESFDDFVLRCVLMGVDKGAIESLIKTGALGVLVQNRQAAIENLPAYISACRTAIRGVYKQAEENGADNVIPLEGRLPRWVYNQIAVKGGFKLPTGLLCAEYDYTTILQMEKDSAGFYVSGNPLEKHRDVLTKYVHSPISDVSEGELDVTLVGHISNRTILKRKSDGKSMCKFMLEDLTGTIEAICFVNQYERFGKQLSEGSIAMLKGKVEAQNDLFNEGEEKALQFIVRSGRKLA